MAWVGDRANDNEKKGVNGLVDKYLAAMNRDETSILFVPQSGGGTIVGIADRQVYKYLQASEKCTISLSSRDRLNAVSTIRKRAR